MPVGQTAMHCLAVDAISLALPTLAGFVRPARLATPGAIGDQQRIVIEHRALNARPRAHIDADLLARDAAEQIGRDGEDADETIGHERRVEIGKLTRKRWRIGKIEHECAAGRDRDQEPS